tara:strand:+ start:14680 stop:16368 length:1689 start_codon:yes stop_codon:yes gene_type:complete
MLIFLKKIKNLLDKKFQIKFFFYFFITITIMLLEVLGIAILFPIVKIVTTGEIPFKEIVPIREENFLPALSILLLVIFITKNLLLVYLNYWQYKFLGNIQLDLASKLISNYLKMPYKFFINSNTTIMVKNIDESQNFTTYLNAILNIVLETIIIIAILILLLKINFTFTILAALFTLLISFIFYSTTKLKLVRWSKERMSISRKFLKEILETLNSVREIKTYKKENIFVDLNNQNLSDQIKIAIKTNMLKILPRSIYEVSFIFLICMFLLYLSFSNILLINILPTLSLFIAAGIKLIPSGNKILSQYQIARMCKLSIEVLNKELKKQLSIEKKISDNKKKIIDLDLKNLKIKDLNFSYDNKKIFENLNLEFKKGKIYGIIGPSGSGKTTLANLILGLLNQQSGEILINDNYKLEEIENSFQSFLPQKIFMLDNTIKANIVFDPNQKEINEDTLNNVIKTSKLGEFIESLKLKTDERVGENATKLSGGQMQRLAIARAIYHDSQLIIFDEPTSSLDKENEEKIFESISSLKQNKILIIISHSDEVLKYVDHKILIDNNQVIFH